MLAGRCVAYGEGTTYRALAEIVRGLGDDPQERVEELLDGDEQSVRGILGAIGLSDEPAQVEEIAWALRRLLEQLARDRPLVVAVEDIHWAEPALLDLLDHVVALSSGAPILLVCLTRPELLEERPAWAAPQPNRSVLVLDALADTQARELATLLGANGLAGRIAQRAEGNPLFVEQLVAVDAGHDEGDLPASIQAVLAARIDGLEPGQRTLLRHAAIEGRTFHSGALEALLPAGERRGVGRHLVALARKGLIGPDRPEFAGQDAFRFTHALIREAAYAGVPKLLRADLHAGGGRVARAPAGGGRDRRPSPRADLPAARRARASRPARARHRAKGSRVPRSRVARRAGARRSRRRERAARACAGRRCVRPRGARRAAARARRGAVRGGRMTEATRVLDEAIASAPGPRIEARARIEREFVRLETETSSGIERSQHLADTVLAVFERDSDDLGQGRVWALRAQVAWIAGQMARADEAWCEAAACARRAGQERELFGVLRWRATAAVLGPTPVGEAIARCMEFREVVIASPVAVAWTDNALAVLHAMRGDYALAERTVAGANATLGQLGSLSSSVSHHEALVGLLAGRPELAETPLREGVQRLAAMGDGGLLATTTAMLAQAVYAQGQFDEAGELCDATAATAAPDDIITQVIWRGVKAKTLAREQRFEEGEALAREAVALVEPTDLLSHYGDALLDLGEVLRLASHDAATRDAVRSGLALYESKGNVAAATRARALLG